MMQACPAACCIYEARPRLKYMMRYLPASTSRSLANAAESQAYMQVEVCGRQCKCRALHECGCQRVAAPAGTHAPRHASAIWYATLASVFPTNHCMATLWHITAVCRTSAVLHSVPLALKSADARSAHAHMLCTLHLLFSQKVQPNPSRI